MVSECRIPPCKPIFSFGQRISGFGQRSGRWSHCNSAYFFIYGIIYAQFQRVAAAVFTPESWEQKTGRWSHCNSAYFFIYGIFYAQFQRLADDR